MDNLESVQVISRFLRKVVQEVYGARFGCCGFTSDQRATCFEMICLVSPNIILQKQTLCLHVIDLTLLSGQ